MSDPSGRHLLIDAKLASWKDSFPQVEPVVTCRLHPGKHSFLIMLCLYVKDPCPELCETRLSISELEWLLRVFDSSPVKCPGIIEFAADINTYNQSFFSLRNYRVWMAALGQIFFSLSVGFGIMLIYSSYLRRRRSNLVGTGLVAGFAKYI